MFLIWQSHGVTRTYDLSEPKIRKKINKQVGWRMKQDGMDPQTFKGQARFADAHYAIYYKIGRCATFEQFEIVRELPMVGMEIWI